MVDLRNHIESRPHQPAFLNRSLNRNTRSNDRLLLRNIDHDKTTFRIARPIVASVSSQENRIGGVHDIHLFACCRERQFTGQLGLLHIADIHHLEPPELVEEEETIFVNAPDIRFHNASLTGFARLGSVLHFSTCRPVEGWNGIGSDTLFLLRRHKFMRTGKSAGIQIIQTHGLDAQPLIVSGWFELKPINPSLPIGVQHGFRHPCPLTKAWFAFQKNLLVSFWHKSRDFNMIVHRNDLLDVRP